MRVRADTIGRYHARRAAPSAAIERRHQQKSFFHE
jgi:hypothetical protein